MTTFLYNSIKTEILADTYLAARINLEQIERQLIGMHKTSELSNVFSKDYKLYASLAFNDDSLCFFAYPIYKNTEDYKKQCFEKIALRDITKHSIKRILWTEYAATIILYLELDIEIPNIWKNALIDVLDCIIDIYINNEELSPVLLEISKARKILKDKIKEK